MHYHLHRQTEMEPRVNMLFTMVEENYERLRGLLEKVSEEELFYKGPGQAYNSIGQLLKHLALVDLQWNYRIKEEPLPVELEKAYGPELDATGKLPAVESGSTIADVLDDYDFVFQSFKETCKTLKDEELDKIIPYNDHTATIGWGIWHMADHSRYHQAHIVLMRKWFRQRQ
ncbi:DinB family protein [Shouchella clausii]|uniref:DinB family protein n=1 Tax=Shouchella clausii TaxID=79880 RepID=UPI000BA7AD74|nr:DinB family protein [Shouchella clausii]MCY1105026.1 DinB family protein [Shouchella clausii]MED4157478.1 DinB family protein [Shouchella clausii]MED4177695.1 DinB family protein [Shouchella clausii]PAD91314.1 hypothetical protein CHH52_15815 [Shouchella clausii]PTL23237.1 DinB family protein [Shouchella clausii]